MVPTVGAKQSGGMIGQFQASFDTLDATDDSAQSLAVATGQCVQTAQGLLNSGQPQLDTIQSLGMVAECASNRAQMFKKLAPRAGKGTAGGTQAKSRVPPFVPGGCHRAAAIYQN